MKLFSNAWINKEDIKKYDVKKKYDAKKITCLKYLFLQDHLYIFLSGCFICIFSC